MAFYRHSFSSRYSLPETPAFALLIAAGLVTLKREARRSDSVLASIFLAGIGAAILAAPLIPKVAPLLIASELTVLRMASGLFFAAAAAVAFWRLKSHLASIVLIGSVSTALVAAASVAMDRPAFDGLDVRPIASTLAEIERAGQPISHQGRYHGQFQFAGRLQRPLEVVNGADALKRWAEVHPDASGVIYSYRPLQHATARPQAMQKFKGRFVYVWRGADLAGVSDAWTRGRNSDHAS